MTSARYFKRKKERFIVCVDGETPSPSTGVEPGIFVWEGQVAALIYLSRQLPYTHTHTYIYTHTFLFDKLYIYTHPTKKRV